MEIKDIEKALTDALQMPEDANLRIKYCDAVTEYLKENKSSDEILSIVIRGIDIDHAANYFDLLESASWNELQSIMKQIRQSKDVKENKDNHALKFLAGMLSLAFWRVGNMENLCGNIITMIVSIITAEKDPFSVDVYKPILREYILDDMIPKASLPQWTAVKARGEVCQHFAEIVLKSTDGENSEKYKSVRLWATRGIRYAEEQIKKEKIEERIPKSRITDLTEIVEHYKVVEKKLRECVYEIAKLQEEIGELHKEIEALRREKHVFEGKIQDLTQEITIKQQQIDKVEKEVDERAAINEAFGALKKNDETALLKDIANELKAEYLDFVETDTDEMDVELGEIYREKLRNIFKILNKKGITME